MSVAPATNSIACIRDIHTDIFADPMTISARQKPYASEPDTVCVTSIRKSLNNEQRQSAREMTKVMANREQTELKDDWRKVVSISDEYDDHGQEVTNMLGHLSTIKTVHHHIDLQLGSRPVYRLPYRATTSQREFEKKKIYKMLAKDVIEPAQSQWEFSIVFAPKKDGCLRFRGKSKCSKEIEMIPLLRPTMGHIGSNE